MSTDLWLNIDILFSIEDLKSFTHKVLHDLLNSEDIPKIKIGYLKAGVIYPTSNNSIIETDTTYYMQYEGRDVKVLLTPMDKKEYCDLGNGFDLAFSVGSTRSPEEYVLGLAGAIAMGLKFNSIVEDQQLFWSNSLESDPKRLLEELAVEKNRGMTFSESCKQLVGNRLD